MGTPRADGLMGDLVQPNPIDVGRGSVVVAGNASVRQPLGSVSRGVPVDRRVVRAHAVHTHFMNCVARTSTGTRTNTSCDELAQRQLSDA